MLPLFFIGNIVWAQNRPLTGTVKNSENGAAIVGASVVIKGTTKGTVTNNDGKFTLDVPTKGTNNVLVISSVGFTSTEIKLTNQTSIAATLTTDSKLLEDAVVIGYGSVKKKDLTGAVGTVSAKEITSFTRASARGIGYKIK